MNSAILKNGVIIDADGARRETLYVSEGRVTQGPAAGAMELDLDGYLIFPGMINAHDHLHLNAIPPLAPCGVKFENCYEWVDAWGERMSEPDVMAVRALPKDVRHWHGALKNILCGATTVAHHDPSDRVFDDPLFPVRVVRRFGWSHSLGLGLAHNGAAPKYGPAVVESHASTPTDEPWIIHLAEGVDDVAAGELQTLDALGCLTANTVLMHGVGLSDPDIDRVIASGAGVVWCPQSNIEMFGRALDPRRLMRAGRMALGSDSRITGSRDLLDELRVAASLAPDVAPAELFGLVTEAARRLLRMQQAGGFAVGQYADLIVVRNTGGDPYETLLSLRRSDICAVVRDGRPVVADTEFRDWFDACGVSTAQACLDGKSKVIAADALGPDGAAVLEPGLEVDIGHRHGGFVEVKPTLEPLAAYALWASVYPAHAHNPVMKAEERAMLSLLAAGLTSINVLDAGCGSGRYLRHAIDRGASAVVGVDFSEPMLRRGIQSQTGQTGLTCPTGSPTKGSLFVCGSLSALPVCDRWADVILCGLALGHVTDLRGALAELGRVTRTDGLILCSDFHPIGATLGWTRDFKADGKRYAVHHTVHTLDMWREACSANGLCIETVLEPHLDPSDIPPDARFDRRALEVPVALVIAIRHQAFFPEGVMSSPIVTLGMRTPTEGRGWSPLRRTLGPYETDSTTY